jgi:hypothetical protein
MIDDGNAAADAGFNSTADICEQFWNKMRQPAIDMATIAALRVITSYFRLKTCHCQNLLRRKSQSQFNTRILEAHSTLGRATF